MVDQLIEPLVILFQLPHNGQQLTYLSVQMLTDIMAVSYERKRRLLSGEFHRFTGDVPHKTHVNNIKLCVS